MQNMISWQDSVMENTRRKQRYTTEVKVNTYTNINRLNSNDWYWYLKMIIGGSIANNDLDIAVLEYLEECLEGRCVHSCDLQEKARDVAANF